MKENQEELDKEMADTQPEPEIDVEAAEGLGVSEVEAEEFKSAKLKAELEEMKDKYLRTRAEVVNVVSRGKNGRERLQKYRSQGSVKELLPSIDNLEHALAAEVSDDQGANLKKGVEMVLESLRNALEEEEIEKISAKGESFDPNLHQAVQTVPATKSTLADTIVEIPQEGYKSHGRVLRPTMVIVT